MQLKQDKRMEGENVVEITAQEFIESYFGKRCSEFVERCLCCEAWKHFDELVETHKILADKKLMNAIRKTRKEGSKSSPYKPLV